MDDRLLSFKILSKIEHDKAYSNITLDSLLTKYEASSSAFVCALVYGVLERKITLDYILTQFLTQPIKKLNPHVLQILDIGINNPSLLPLKIVVQLSTDFLHFGHFIECKRSIRQILVIIYPTKPNTG